MSRITKKDVPFLLKYAMVRGGVDTATAARRLKKPYMTVSRWLKGEAMPGLADGLAVIALAGESYDEVLKFKDRAAEARTLNS